MKKLIVLAGILLATNANAGAFVDFDIGAFVNGYHHHALPEAEPHLGDANPIFQFRIGYESPRAPLPWDVDVTGHMYLQHTSSMGTGTDSGPNLLMFGTRIEL